MDVVESTIRQLEDSGILNAGKFANANADKFVETDASIMDGRTRAAGAVASMRHVKNPIHAARLVMERSPHVLMVGDRGEAYAATLGAELVPDEYFPNNEWKVGGDSSDTHRTSEHGTDPSKRIVGKVSGTVGAVAMDRCGDLAAGTSTGGFGAKIPGRVGDSPIIGAGTFAENGVAAVSATGHGEFFIRFSVAANIAARVKYLKQSLGASVHQAIEELDAADAEGGLVGIDATGKVVMQFNRAGMVRGYTTQKDEPTAFAYK